jgi:2-polyprenyl-3-methyl-5-hydroxy-6-metoxy-1,4-benzoquinol methylase
VSDDLAFPSKLARSLNESYERYYTRVNPMRANDVRKANGNLQATFGGLLDALPAGSPVLDVGCGGGILLSWIAGKPNLAIAGVDSSPGQIEAARRALPEAELHCGDGLEFLERHPESFRAILCFDVLEHVAGDDRLLAWVHAARRALLPEGFFLCRVPNGANLAAGYVRYIDLTHRRAFTSTSLLQLLELAFDRAEILPIRSGHLAGRIRLRLEHAVHRAVFRLCSHTLERFFTRDIYGLARPPAPAISPPR